jgi:hypothetical protein
VRPDQQIQGARRAGRRGDSPPPIPQMRDACH